MIWFTINNIIIDDNTFEIKTNGVIYNNYICIWYKINEFYLRINVLIACN